MTRQVNSDLDMDIISPHITSMNHFLQLRNLGLDNLDWSDWSIGGLHFKIIGSDLEVFSHKIPAESMSLIDWTQPISLRQFLEITLPRNLRYFTPEFENSDIGLTAKGTKSLEHLVYMSYPGFALSKEEFASALEAFNEFCVQEPSMKPSLHKHCSGREEVVYRMSGLEGDPLIDAMVRYWNFAIDLLNTMPRILQNKIEFQVDENAHDPKVQSLYVFQDDQITKYKVDVKYEVSVRNGLGYEDDEAETCTPWTALDSYITSGNRYSFLEIVRIVLYGHNRTDFMHFCTWLVRAKLREFSDVVELVYNFANIEYEPDYDAIRLSITIRGLSDAQIVEIKSYAKPNYDGLRDHESISNSSLNFQYQYPLLSRDLLNIFAIICKNGVNCD